MALPAWVYNQSSLPPWMRSPTVPNRPRAPIIPPQGMPGPAIGPGNNPGIVRNSFFPTSSGPQTPQTLYGTPPPSTMQHGGGGVNPVNTNPGMVGMLPPGNPGSNVPAPSPQFTAPQFENTPAIPQYQDDPSIFADLAPRGPNPLNSEYAGIMSQLQSLLNAPQQTYTPFVPKEQQYTQSPELTSAIQMIRELAESGGYSESAKSSLRARGVSPIRSVYANAQQNLDRSKALQGGYSPGHTAATTKLARELSDRIAGQTTNVNADIAEKVAQGKMAMAPQLGNITSHVNDLVNQIAGGNVGAQNEAGMFNTKMGFDVNQANVGNRNQLLGMIQNLFGTNADIQGRDADRAVNIAGLRQRGNESRNQFNMQGRELEQRGVESRNRNALDLSNARNQFDMQGRELDQNMQQFLRRLGLDTAELNQRGNIAGQGNQLDWARLNQQGGLGLIQALMEMMGQQGRA